MSLLKHAQWAVTDRGLTSIKPRASQSPLGKSHDIVAEARSRPTDANGMVAAETWASVSQSILRRREIVSAPMLCCTRQRLGSSTKPLASSGRLTTSITRPDRACAASAKRFLQPPSATTALIQGHNRTRPTPPSWSCTVRLRDADRKQAAVRAHYHVALAAHRLLGRIKASPALRRAALDRLRIDDGKRAAGVPPGLLPVGHDQLVVDPVHPPSLRPRQSSQQMLPGGRPFGMAPHGMPQRWT